MKRTFGPFPGAVNSRLADTGRLTRRNDRQTAENGGVSLVSGVSAGRFGKRSGRLFGPFQESARRFIERRYSNALRLRARFSLNAVRSFNRKGGKRGVCRG